MLESMSVDKIVARAQFSIGEPGHISMSKGTAFDVGERLVPSHQLSSKSSPKLIGILNGLLVSLLIVLQAMNVRSCRMCLMRARSFKLLCICSFENNLFSNTSVNCHREQREDKME